MNWIWGLIIAAGAAGLATLASVRGGRRARRRERETLETRHRAELESRDANFAQQGRELEAQGQKLATCVEGAAQCAQALETEKRRSNQLANQVDQLAGQLQAERAEAAAQLEALRADAAQRLERAVAAQKAAEGRADSLAHALDEIGRIIDATKISLGEAGTAIDQIRIAAGNAGNGGEPARWTLPAEPGAKPH
jgi:hypothetical protein